MNKYLVFAGDCYYADGGWDDFIGDYSSLKEAKLIADKEVKINSLMSPDSRWAEVVDRDKKMIVYKGHG